MKKCVFDPKRYFFIKEIKKFVLIYDKMAKNNILVEYESKKNLITSFQFKIIKTILKTTILIKDGKLHLKAIGFTEQIPILIMFKAMNIESEYFVF